MLVDFEAHRDDPPLGEHECPIVKERSHPRTRRTEDIAHKILPDRSRPRCRRRGQRQPAFGLYLHVARGGANPSQPTMSKVVLFSTSACSWSRRAKRYFREQRVPFKEVNLEPDPEAARDVVRKTGQTGVPVD